MTTEELNAALARFRAEAVEGVAVTPRYRMKYFDLRPPLPSREGLGEGSSIASSASEYPPPPLPGREGRKTPLLIIHGLNDVPRSFVPLMMQLKESFRCIAPELADGDGDGAFLPHYRHEHYPLDMLALLDHLQLDTVDVLGSSFGSTIALRLAATAPERVRRVILQGGFARRPLNAIERGLAHVGRSWPWRMGQLPLRPRIMRHLEAPAFVNAPTMIHFLLENSALSPIRATTHRGRILTTLDLRPLLKEIPQPVLMIGGDRDAIVPRWCEAEVEAGVGDVRRIEYANCGHYPQYTHVKQLAESVRAFLSDCGSNRTL